MDGKTFPRQVAGQPIAAATINAPLDAIEAALKLGGAAPLSVSKTAGGTTITLEVQPPFWAKLTGGTGTGPYTWTEQLAQPSGAWAAGYLDDGSGSDPAYNTIAATPANLPIIVELRRNAAGVLTFTAGTC